MITGQYPGRWRITSYLDNRKLNDSRGVANWLRRKSREATAVKPEDILDVESSAVDAAFRKANIARIVHGHTHRPAHHRLVVDGRACERYVLADWYDREYYTNSPKDNPTGPSSGERKTFRGGSWNDSPRSLRVTARFSADVEYQDQSIGFRCAMDAGPGADKASASAKK